MTDTATQRPESEIEKRISAIEDAIFKQIGLDNKFLAEGHIFSLGAFIAQNLKAVYPTPASVDNARIQHVEAVREKLILNKLAEAKKLADSRDIGYNSKLQDMVHFITTSFDDYKHRTNYMWAIDAGKKIDHAFKSKEFEGYYKKLYDEIFIRMLGLDRSDAINLHKQFVALDDCVSEFGSLIKPYHDAGAYETVLTDHVEAIRESVLINLFRGAFSLAESLNPRFADNFDQADFVSKADVAGRKPDVCKYNAWIKAAKAHAEKKYIDVLTGKMITGAASSS